MSDPSLGHILIVDDEQTVRDVLAEYFVEQGYQVSTASSGIEALRGLAESHPDLVLLDVRMPGIDGIETLRRLRQAAPGISVIMVTANEDVDLARDTLQLGALDYVAKPFDFAYLERSVMASLVHASAARAAAVAAEPWRDLVLAAFRVARAISNTARTSTGARLEDAALRAARAAAARPDDAKAALAELELLLGVAGQLPGRAGADVSRAQRAVNAVRAALSGA